MTRLEVAICKAAPVPLAIGEGTGEGEETLFAEIDLDAFGEGLASLDTDGHYSRPDVFELSVNTQVKDGVRFNS